jgi:hypothetical protein
MSLPAWTADQVSATAPDPASAKAEQGLASPRKWVLRLRHLTGHEPLAPTEESSRPCGCPAPRTEHHSNRCQST